MDSVDYIIDIFSRYYLFIVLLRKIVYNQIPWVK